MTEMQIPIVITKKDCHRCVELKDWMKENDVKYAERDIDDEEFVHQLLQDKNFLGTFCDADGCIVNTPAVMYQGKYWFKELWGISGLRKKEAAKLFLN
ncbi:hypothetical protein LCGC14_2354150 [marine sediment metagenome]|uniref:Glutaredoxin domain-containing protein n=1 Tax=marine sediment metagenome TaxID=412755 RepID=A0A0F9CVV3_9ZZZZ